MEAAMLMVDGCRNKRTEDRREGTTDDWVASKPRRLEMQDLAPIFWLGMMVRGWSSTL